LKRALEEELLLLELLSPTILDEKDPNASDLKRGDVDLAWNPEEKWSRSRKESLSLSLPGAPLMGIPVSPMNPPVRVAMCASISFFAVSTDSGNPVTSKMGSLSREGVMM
jgi:hypothetical protein